MCVHKGQQQQCLDSLALFYRHALSEVARLIHVAP